MNASVQSSFGSLPIELFLNILDHLVGTRDGRQPIAYAPSDGITKALRSLTLVSQRFYPVASRYLYAHCLYLDNCTSYNQFRRTFGLEIKHGHPQALEYGQAGRNERLFQEANALKHITSLFFSPHKDQDEVGMPMVRLPQVIDLCNVVGPTLKRLAMDTHPVYTPKSEVEQITPHIVEHNIFSNMPHLEELVCSWDMCDYFPIPPPNLKRLAMSIQEVDDAFTKFWSSVPTLETLFILRDPELEASHVHSFLDRYEGQHLDVVLIDVSANHATPEGTRGWTPEDIVYIYEVDVPKSYYGDEDDLLLCDGWFWTNAVRGTLWNQDKRRMKSTKVE